jgi:putative aldouronate transport system permease protein
MLEKTNNLDILPVETKSLPKPITIARYRQFFRKNGTLLLMAAPGILLLFIFAYLPMGGLVIAFKNFRADQGIWGSAWAGLDNFRFLFSTSDAWRITFNTLFLNAAFIVTTVVGALVVALLLNEVQHTVRARFYQSALFFPYFLSWVVVGYIGFAFLSTDGGFINTILMGLGGKPIAWYSQPNAWVIIITIVNLWKNVGFWSIVYLAGILAISPEFYEAAKIDGAGKWQQTRYITLPLLTPLIVINVLLSIGRIFYADFGLFFNVTRDSSLLYPTMDVIDTYVYRALRSLGDVGMASAAGFYQSVVGFVLVLIANRIVKRYDPEKALF